jgi:uncharacterized membrane protein YqjE
MITARRAGRNGRSTGELVKDLSQQASTLMRQEIQLAKTEMTEKAKGAGIGIGALAGAAVACLLGLGSFTAFLILALDGAMAGWAAGLLVAVAWALVAVGLGFYGRDKLRDVGPPVPEKTVETVKEDIQWLKHPTS